MSVQRCPWCEGDDAMTEYHDKEWGTPVHDDSTLFEFLILESAQAGLSWRTILLRRDGYRRAYLDFDIEAVSGFSADDAARLKDDTGIIRNTLKIKSSINCANGVLEIQRECGSLSNYFWSFVDGTPVVGHWRSMEDVPVTTSLSDTVSHDLKKRGFTFVGSTIIYSFLQATGVVNDHITSCFRYGELTGGR